MHLKDLISDYLKDIKIFKVFLLFKIMPTIDDKISRIKEKILGIVPETGQFPFILLHQVRRVLSGYEIAWSDMQVAFDQLYEEGRIAHKQNFSSTICRRAYKTG